MLHVRLFSLKRLLKHSVEFPDARMFSNNTLSNEKLSYRRESALFTSLYRTVQKAFQYVEPLKGVGINYRQC